MGVERHYTEETSIANLLGEETGAAQKPGENTQTKTGGLRREAQARHAAEVCA